MSVQSGAGNQAQAQNQAFTGSAQAAAAGMEGINVNVAPPNENKNDNTWSFIGPGLSDLVSVKSGGADVRSMVTLIEQIIATDTTANSPYAVKPIIVDNTVETGWRYSAVVLCVLEKATNIVAFYPMLLESTESAPLEVETREIGMNQVQILRVPSDGMDRSYIDNVIALVGKAYPGSNIMDAGGMVVPASVDASSEEQVRPILSNATRACVTVMVEANPSFVDLNLGMRKDNTFQNVTLSIHSNDHSNIVNEPIRQDVVVTLTARSNQSQHQQNQNVTKSINQGSASEITVGSVRGFIDVSFAPQNAGAAVGYGPQYGMADPFARTRQFVKRLVITDLHQPRLATLPSALMMLFMATSIGEPSVSDSVFFQNMKNHRLETGGKDKGFDPTDVGVLNLISNVRNTPADQPVAPYDLKSASVTQGEFTGFMQSVFVPDWALSIDVPRAGPSSWVLNVFSGAAAGNPNALEEIVRAADKLTAGRFSHYFFANQQGNQKTITVDSIFSEVNNTVHMGYYLKQGADGQVKRDIRHIDYLYVLNRYGQIDKTPLDWAMSFLVDKMNPYQRMSRRKEIIEAAVSGKVYFTDFAERHTFKTHFLQSLVMACVDTKLKPNFQYNNPLAGATSALAAPQFVGGGGLVGGQLSQTGFVTNGMQTSAGGVYNNPTMGRWVS